MARLYLDETTGIYNGFTRPYMPPSPFMTQDYVTPVSSPDMVQAVVQPKRRVTKTNKSKPKKTKNDNIIRNHDSVWDYKIENGKLLTRRKTSDGKWYDITSNDEARTRIESFTGRTINKPSTSNSTQQKQSNTQSNNSSVTSTTPASTTSVSTSTSTSTSKSTTTPSTTKASASKQQTPSATTDTTTQKSTTNRTLNNTPGKVDFSKMSDAEVDAWFANNPKELPEITVTRKVQQPTEPVKITAGTIKQNGWHLAPIPKEDYDLAKAMSADEFEKRQGRSKQDAFGLTFKDSKGNYFSIHNSDGSLVSRAQLIGNSVGKKLLNQDDLDANGWHWSNGNHFGDMPTENDNLLLSARNKADAGDNILLDSNGAVVPTSEVRRYINRGRIPLYVSDYDAQFWQPQTESKPHEVRMAELQRWVRDFDRQRNIGLATMFGLPALAATSATAPITTIAAIAGGELLNSGAKAVGLDWDKWAGGDDPTTQMYAGMINPFRLAGNIAGGMGGSYAEPYVASAVNAGKSAIGNSMRNAVGYGQDLYNYAAIARMVNKGLKPGKPINASDLPVNVNELPQASPKPSQSTNDPLAKMWGDAEIEAFEQEQAKAFWEQNQPYEVKGVRKVEVKSKDGSSRFVYVPKLGNKLVDDVTVSGVYRFNQVPFMERLRHPIQSLPRLSNWNGLRTRTGLERFPVRTNAINDTEGVGDFLRTLNMYYGSEYPKEHFFSIPYSIYP